MDVLAFSPRRYTNVPAIELAKKLGSLLPGDLKRVLFAPGGSSAISMALKLARMVTGKHKIISLWDSFHGASLDTIAAGGERDFRKGMGPLTPGVERIPPAMTYRGPFASGGDDLAYAEYLEYVIEKEGDIGAFLIETIRNTDVQIPSTRYWKKVREICTRHNVLLILDEIPIAFGRTGKMFAVSSPWPVLLPANHTILQQRFRWAISHLKKVRWEVSLPWRCWNTSKRTISWRKFATTAPTCRRNWKS
jgi:4-aminobutyrate aminotransferase